MLVANLDRGLSYLLLFYLAVGALLLPFSPELLLLLPLVIVPSLVVAAFSYRSNPNGRWWLIPFGVAVFLILLVATLILIVASKI